MRFQAVDNGDNCQRQGVPISAPPSHFSRKAREVERFVSCANPSQDRFSSIVKISRTIFSIAAKQHCG
jgi:hypothetical protein